MAPTPERDDELANLLIDLENAAHVPARQRAINVSSLVDRVCSNAYQDGLPNASLDKLIDIITLPNELAQGILGNLIKNLYPASKVSDAVVIKLVGSLGHGQAKPSFSTQASLLKWLVMVFDFLENQKVLSQLYGVLFNLLDTIAIRPQLCHVLSLITRRKHVRPFRIQALMELTREAGNDPPLVGLMRVYKDYYPDVIVGNATAGRASVFTHPNHEWRQRLGEIQDVYLHKTQEGMLPKHETFRVTRNRMNGRRTTSSGIIPEVYTSHAQESSTTLEEVHSVDDFIQKLEKIELPNQLVAVFGDPLLQKYLHLKSSDTTSRRIDNWLIAFFEDQLESLESTQSQILAMLASIRDYTQYTKYLPPACLTFLKSMLPSWNGISGRELILDLLVFVPMTPFEELYTAIFQPLEEAILIDDSTEAKVALLDFYKHLLDQWTVSLHSHPEPRPPAVACSALIDYTNRLALTILQTSLTISVCSRVLCFYEATASLISQPALRSVTRIVTPPSELIYTLYFTHSLSTLSRLCAILALYKRAFEVAMSPKHHENELQVYPKEYVNHFNGFLMDICNCIWRGRAFNTSDANALACLLPAPIFTSLNKYISSLDTAISLPTLFSLSFSPLFCLLAISFVRELEDNEEEEIEIRHAGPVTQASLKQLEKDGGLKLSWADYRLGVLRYVENKGVMGVGELMYNTMKHLMTARENMA